jgi:hypothetical protein
MPETKYGKYFLSDNGAPPGKNDFVSLNSLSPCPEVASPQTYFRGAAILPGATLTMGWQVFIKPLKLERIPHTHDHDEYLMFLGAQLPDLCSSFDAEIDFWMGEELEKHTITSTTIVFIPKGVLHCPLNFRKVNKPVLFHALSLSPTFTAARVKNWDESKFQW